MGFGGNHWAPEDTREQWKAAADTSGNQVPYLSPLLGNRHQQAIPSSGHHRVLGRDYPLIAKWTRKECHSPCIESMLVLSINHFTITWKVLKLHNGKLLLAAQGMYGLVGSGKVLPVAGLMVMFLHLFSFQISHRTIQGNCWTSKTSPPPSPIFQEILVLKHHQAPPQKSQFSNCIQLDILIDKL